MLYALYRLGYHGRATVHGFRSSASSLLNGLGFDPDVIERQLAHQERNKVRAAYHRTEYRARAAGYDAALGGLCGEIGGARPVHGGAAERVA